MYRSLGSSKNEYIHINKRHDPPSQRPRLAPHDTTPTRPDSPSPTTPARSKSLPEPDVDILTYDALRIPKHSSILASGLSVLEKVIDGHVSTRAPSGSFRFSTFPTMPYWPSSSSYTLSDL
ncbi:hypothetical protein ACFX11_028540 [Malus domestica]